MGDRYFRHPFGKKEFDSLKRSVRQEITVLYDFFDKQISLLREKMESCDCHYNITDNTATTQSRTRSNHQEN